MPDKLSEFKTEHLFCRVLQHAWKHEVTYVEKRGRQRVLEVHLKCMRCPTKRIDTLAKGDIVSRDYAYPKDYLIHNLKKGWGGRAVFNRNLRNTLWERLAK